MRFTRHWMLMLATLAVLSLWIAQARADAPAQTFPTSTPVQVDLFQSVPGAQQANATATVTRTPTPLGPVQIESLGVSNVRSQPDPSSELLGQVRPGEYYNAIRRYYQWIEFQYDPAPTKRGWIFGELVQIHGDPNSIPSVTSLDDVGAESANIDATVTGAAITMTPGGLLTQTALARTSPALANAVATGGVSSSAATQGGFTVQIDGIDQVNSTEQATQRVALPTYTYPPGVAAFAPTVEPTLDPAEITTPTDLPDQTITSVLPSSFPPIVPIVGLAALGLLGLVVSLFRR
jgi:hypothetical protein